MQGISPKKNIILAMIISGALAGMLGVNEILGVHHKILVNFPAGYGFTGIAVALMGRNHPDWNIFGFCVVWNALSRRFRGYI